MAECATPVLFIVFNRCDTALQVLAAIGAARPKRLYVAADGPRSGRADERAETEQVRQAILAGIDWPCELKTLFQTENLGCRRGVVAAIDWFFENEAEGIILEDDVVPSPDFFRFCEYGLARYRDDGRIFMISGTNPLGAQSPSSGYFYSSFGSIWGWASWRRAWAHYDVSMKGWPDSDMARTLVRKHGRACALYLASVLNNHVKYDLDTWDSQWLYAILKHGALTVVPAVNLVRNIGILGTHSSVETRNHNLPYGHLLFPLRALSDCVEENGCFRAELTRKLFLPAMLVSSASRIAKRFGLHALLVRVHGWLRAGKAARSR